MRSTCSAERILSGGQGTVSRGSGGSAGPIDLGGCPRLRRRGDPGTSAMDSPFEAEGPSGCGEVPERLPERSEPGLKVPPLVEALLVNRLAHLLGTRGPDAALRLVELEASWL